MIWIAAMACGLGVVLAWEVPEARLFRRLRPVRESGSRASVPYRLRLLWWFVAAVTLAVGYVSVGRVGLVMAIVGVEVMATVIVLAGRARRRRRRRSAQVEVVRAAETLAARLRVGGIPSVVLATTAGEHPVFAEAAASLAVGGDVVSELRATAARPGFEGLADLASAWQVSASTGASLCDTLDAAAIGLVRQHELHATVAVEMAATRAATRLLAVLPVVGVALGYAFGGNPLDFLMVNPLGEVCLMGAVGLTGIGLVWSDVLADRAGEGL